MKNHHFYRKHEYKITHNIISHRRWPRANICRGEFRIGIFCGFPNKPWYLTFPATKRDYFKFPQWIAIWVFFATDPHVFNLLNLKFLGYHCSEADLTNRYKTWPNITKLDQTLWNFDKRYKIWLSIHQEW